MEPHLTEWLNLTVRWVHMVTGIAWIGASFYFVWLENNLDRRTPRPGRAGELWAIHGGGIYHLEKYSLAPPELPDRLHWFKWEAYATWISGLLLLAIVYYLNAELYLLAPGSSLHPAAAAAIGLTALAAGWLVYDQLCDSPLGRHPALLAGLLFILITAAAWGFAQLFSGRAAFIHTGALIGTLMAGNVFRIIIPAQSELVTAIANRRKPDPALPAKAQLRSRHNNYFTLPVLFTMISSHFPSTYGSAYNWAVLAGLALLGVLVRHYFNSRHQSQKYAWALPAAAVGMIALAFVTAPRPPERSHDPSGDNGKPVAFERVAIVIATRCTPCHSATPASDQFSRAPGGVMFDTPEQIRQLAPSIHAQAVASEAMPLGNSTRMTSAERRLIDQWIRQGAPLL